MTLKSFSLTIAALLLTLFATSCRKKDEGRDLPNARISIVASDTILSGMSESLLPAEHFEVVSILPPGQCPGHYDVKLTDIARVKQADLVVSFIGMPYMQRAEAIPGRQLLIDAKDRNWMAPDSYGAGLRLLAGRLSERFPEHKPQISARLELAAREVAEKIESLSHRIMKSGASKRSVIASSMLREPLEWMGFRIAGEYGRPESISAKEIADLIRVGRKNKVAIIVDNLQSGPDAGRGIAEALGAPHVVLSNFPMEKGYAATLSDNVDAVLAAVSSK